jgi:hypothetical protein
VGEKWADPMSDFIYDDQGKCVAWIIDGQIFTGEDKRKIATVDHDGNIYSLQGELVGHLEATGVVRKDKVPEAFTKLL